jgi:hypothetical protein
VKGQPFIEAEKAAGHGVARACRLLKVSRAASCRRRSGALSSRAAADAAITEKITSILATTVSFGPTMTAPFGSTWRHSDGSMCPRFRRHR